MAATNHLATEAEAPDLDEYSGMSIRDIAFAITAWEEGSEDQARAISAIRARAPGMGHNRPALSEALDEELAALRARAGEMLDTAKTARIVDDESAGKVADLVAQIRAQENQIDAAREKRIRPYLDAQRLINARFGDVMRPLVIARQGEGGRGGLRGMLTSYDDERERKAEAQRLRLREEQRKREEDAAAARRVAEEKAAEGKGSVGAELDALKAREEADRAAQRAEAIRPEPIRSTLGQVTRQREIKFKITDLWKCLGTIRKQVGGVSALEQFARTWLGSHFRAIGVETVAKGVSFPGVEVSVEQGPANVRR